MNFTTQDLERAKARRKAKEFLNKIPQGMAIKISDKAIKALSNLPKKIRDKILAGIKEGLFKMKTEKQKGFIYARKMIENGKDLEYLARLIQEAKDFDDFNDFDKGIEDYIKQTEGKEK